jgi:hypothetical protein
MSDRNEVLRNTRKLVGICVVLAVLPPPFFQRAYSDFFRCNCYVFSSLGGGSAFVLCFLYYASSP